MNENGPSDFELQLVNLAAVVEAKKRHGQGPTAEEHAQAVKLHKLLGDFTSRPFSSASDLSSGTQPNPDGLEFTQLDPEKDF
jgi:hypothetical protein